MSTIERQLPRSNDYRYRALSNAKSKNDNLPPGVTVLTPATQTRLNNIEPLYHTLRRNLAVANARSTAATSAKNKAQKKAKLWVTHYFQALNNAIAREEYPESVRAFFHIDVNSTAVPAMRSESNLRLWGERVSSGEAAMITAGYAAIPYPSEASVKAKVDDFRAKAIVQSTLRDATDTAEEALEAKNKEANRVIKKVWDEVETYYNEESGESMRNNARGWGLVYVRLGEITSVTLRAVRSDTGAAIEGAVFKIKSTGISYTANSAGSVTVRTRLVGDEKITASHPLYASLQLDITIVEQQAMTVEFLMVGR